MLLDIQLNTKTLQTFINEDLWDEARVFIGNATFNKGVKAPTLNKKQTQRSYAI
mgnify:CR=1 FL=1